MACKVNHPDVTPKQRVGVFGNDERGSIALMFAGCVFVIGGFVGFALDYGRWHSANSQMQLLLDTATLEVGRALASSGSAAKATEAGERHFEREMSQKWFADKKSPKFEVGPNGTAVIGRFENAVSAPFLSMIGISQLIVKVETKVETASKNASTPAGAATDAQAAVAPAGESAGQKLAAARQFCGALRQHEPMLFRMRLSPELQRAVNEALQRCRETSDTLSDGDGVIPDLGGLRITQ
jgi:hypothetical protein